MKKLSKTNKIKVSVVAALLMVVYGLSLSPSDESIMSKSVMLTNDRGECSGEQVVAASGKTYILSAGHCDSLMDPFGNIMVTTQDGRKMERHVIAEDPDSDLLLIEGVPNLSGLYISSSLSELEHVRTFTHGRGMPTYKTEGAMIGKQKVVVPLFTIDSPESDRRCSESSKYAPIETPMGKVCLLSVEELASTAGIVPGSSGGMVVNDRGELIGVASAGDGFFSYFVSLKDIKAFLHNY